MKLDEDQLLIKKVLNGEKGAFEDLMVKYNKRIYNYVYRMVRNEETAVELTQDFFLKIYNVLSMYNFKYKFSTWAYRICYNLVVDHIRKNSNLIDSLEGDNVNEKRMVESDNYIKENYIAKLENEQVSECLWKIVDCIPVKYKELIILRYINDLKYEEIAEIVNIPVGTVKNRIFKAKKILKKEMENNELFT
jgi:RNA polymerase sigma-70 factor (ECF subfamily)